MAEDREVEARGWNAIDEALKPLYGRQEPLHWGALIPYFLGGEDPLQGISAYRHDGPPAHWHLVTFGFSELYEKESDNPDRSGWGFELTFRLARAPGEEQPPSWAMNFLQNLGRYVFKSCNPFGVGHHMDLNGPIALEHDTRIRAMLMAADPQLPAINTPNGALEFVQVVGITVDELHAAMAWNSVGMTRLLAANNPLLVTDLSRNSILADAAVACAARDGGRRDGSSTRVLFLKHLECAQDMPSPGHMKITFGALSIHELKLLLPNRLLHGNDLVLVAPKTVIRTQIADTCGWTGAQDEVVLNLDRSAIEALVDNLQPRRGLYTIPSAPGLSIEVVPTKITDHEGKVIEVVG